MSCGNGRNRLRGVGWVLAMLMVAALVPTPAAWAQSTPGNETVSIRSGEALPNSSRPQGEDPALRANPSDSQSNNLGGGIPAGPSTGGNSGGRAAFAPRESAPKPPGTPGPNAKPDGNSSAGSDPVGWAMRGLFALLAAPAAFWVLHRPRRVNAVRGPGFEVITPSERRQFIPLEEKVTQLDFVSRIKTVGALRLSANLNKVGLSNRRFGYLMEDKNFRNALLVNRRRVRRTLLKDGDVLDLGDLTLLYRDNRNGTTARQTPVTPPEGKVIIKFDRMRGPVRRGTPMLTSEAQPNRVFYLTTNLAFIGRSEDNDLIIKSQNVQNRHAKIERVGSRFKLQDLSMMGNTFVNNRRVEIRYLREGDEIAIDSHRFKFGIVSKPLRERPPVPEATAEEVLTETEDVATVEENSALAGEQDAERAQS
jgi:pSer/pThr/pTyr-binding forkhead associated (FHA) protein